MPQIDLRPSQDFLNDLLSGLPDTDNRRLASLLKTAVVSADPEIPAGFMHIAGNQFLFEAAEGAKLGSYPWDDGGVWKLVATQDGRKMLVRSDKYDEVRNAGLLQTAAEAMYDVGDHVSDGVQTGTVQEVDEMPDGSYSYTVDWPDGETTDEPEDLLAQFSSLRKKALQAEPPERTIPPEIARDKLNRLRDKARVRDLSQQEQELLTALEDALRDKGLLD